MSQPFKVAILGGGMGALAAAFKLVTDEATRGKVDITVYQRGHLLGGKGASGRDMQRDGRIEEHGLHILMGFYDHVFYVLKTCYDELRQQKLLPLQDGGKDAEWWSGILESQDDVFVMEPYQGRWEPWQVAFPGNNQKIGQPPSDPIDVVERLFLWALQLSMSSVHDQLSPIWALQHDASIEPRLKKLWRDNRDSLTGNAVSEIVVNVIASTIRGLLESRWALSSQTILTDRNERREWLKLYIPATIVCGLVDEGMLSGNSLSSIDHIDFKEWMKMHAPVSGIPPELSWDSPPVNAIYDLVFARRHGKPGCPPAATEGWAAGYFIRATLMTFIGYRGHIFYKMKGGMGDVVFAPLYLFLKAHGVKFRFFHQVQQLVVDDDHQRIKTIQGVIEQRPDDNPDYHPLIKINGFPCWPSQPKEWYDCGTKLEPKPFELAYGSDFDAVVLGIGVGALGSIAAQLTKNNPRFGAMVAHTKTIRTHAFQIWTDKSLQELGWKTKTPIIGSYELPFNAWCDMSLVLSTNPWQRVQPKHVSYFCDAVGDHVSAEGAYEASFAQAKDWLNQHAFRIFPKAATPGAFNWQVLSDGDNRQGEARFLDQYVRCNVDASDRYTLATQGSTKYRLDANESGFDNVVLAGDWVKNPLGAGCMEGAAIGGFAAADAIARLIPPERYVEIDGDLVFPHPVVMEGVHLWALPLQCDPDALQNLCDRLLATPTQGRIRATPECHNAILAFSNMARIRSGDPDYERRGYLTERSASIWIPVQLTGGLRNDLPRQAWLSPYMWVDNPLSLILGRELFGLPKNLGTIALPSDPEEELFGAVDAVVLPERGFHVDVQARRIINVQRIINAHSAPTISSMRTHARKLFDRWETLSIDKNPTVSLVMLRQLRDVAIPAAPAFQEIVLCSGKLTQAQGHTSSELLNVALIDYESVHLQRDLGVTSSVSFFAELECNFTLDRGTVLWRK